MTIANLSTSAEEISAIELLPEGEYTQDEDEWELQSCEEWVKKYNEAQTLKNLRVIKHWFLLEEGDTNAKARVRGIYKDTLGTERIITTSQVVGIQDKVLTTISGSKYLLSHNIDGTGVDDIIKYWPMYQR